MSHLMDKLHHALHRAKGHDGDAKAEDGDGFQSEHFVDLTIKFIRAEGLPKMDIIESADPYFVAKLEDKLSYT